MNAAEYIRAVAAAVYEEALEMERIALDADLTEAERQAHRDIATEILLSAEPWLLETVSEQLGWTDADTVRARQVSRRAVRVVRDDPED